MFLWIMNSVTLENLHGHICGTLKDRHRVLLFLSQSMHALFLFTESFHRVKQTHTRNQVKPSKLIPSTLQQSIGFYSTSQHWHCHLVCFLPHAQLILAQQCMEYLKICIPQWKGFYTILASNNMLIGHMKVHLECSVMFFGESEKCLHNEGASFFTTPCKGPFPGLLSLSSTIISSLQEEWVPWGQDQVLFILCTLCLAWHLMHTSHSTAVYSEGVRKNGFTFNLSNRDSNTTPL